MTVWSVVHIAPIERLLSTAADVTIDAGVPARKTDHAG